ncbi:MULTISPECIES: hypothetical protein [Priestia]|uniref:hypothetical protein n=1 Tax=Priestia TaxID=2800373 RepID=UPI0018A2DA13|nr:MULTISPECIES: hypothetical protein [Priestia]QTL48895.1 hypothetical protein J5Z55_22990 [Priestia aryabhattai]
MIGGQGKDSCGKSGRGETPQKAKSCMQINSGVTSDSYRLMHPICWSVDSIDLVMSQSLFYEQMTATVLT